MYLFSRQARLAPGNTHDAMTWAANITEKVKQITSLDVSLFTKMFSTEVGTLAWTAFVPDLETIETANDKLLADNGYIAMVDAGAKFGTTGADDLLGQIISGEPQADRPVEYATVVATTCTNGNLVKGMKLAVTIAERAQEVTGVPVLVSSSVTGNFGAIAWLSGYADIQALERSQQALDADAKFMEFIDKNVNGVYADEPAVTQQTIWRRVVA
jgi:hypothetical protein